MENLEDIEAALSGAGGLEGYIRWRARNLVEQKKTEQTEKVQEFLTRDHFKSGTPFIITPDKPNETDQTLIDIMEFMNKNKLRAGDQSSYFVIDNQQNRHWECEKVDVQQGVTQHITSLGTENSCGAYTLINILRDKFPEKLSQYSGQDFTDHRIVRDILSNALEENKNNIPKLDVIKLQQSLFRIKTDGEMLTSEDITYVCQALDIPVYPASIFKPDADLGLDFYRGYVKERLAKKNSHEMSLINEFLDGASHYSVPDSLMPAYRNRQSVESSSILESVVQNAAALVETLKHAIGKIFSGQSNVQVTYDEHTGVVKTLIPETVGPEKYAEILRAHAVSGIQNLVITQGSSGKILAMMKACQKLRNEMPPITVNLTFAQTLNLDPFRNEIIAIQDFLAASLSTDPKREPRISH
jgi:hypothetical protein